MPDDDFIDAFAWRLTAQIAKSIDDEIMSGVRRDLRFAMIRNSNFGYVAVDYVNYDDKPALRRYTELHQDVSTDYSKSEINRLKAMATLGSVFFPPQEAEFTMIEEK